MTNPRLENHSGLQRSLLAPNSSSGGSVLARLQSSSFSENNSGSALQSQVDGLVTHFVDEATDLRGLASLAAGSLAYRYTRFGVMALGEGRLTASFLRPLSIGLGLGGEVVAFEGTS